jgi:hypothetical protein
LSSLQETEDYLALGANSRCSVGRVLAVSDLMSSAGIADSKASLGERQPLFWRRFSSGTPLPFRRKVDLSKPPEPAQFLSGRD